MGEPLNFVAGGEKLFKNYLRELLAILCMRGRVSSRRRALRVAIITYSNEESGVWREHRNHMMSLARAKLAKFHRSPARLPQRPYYSPITAQCFHCD